MNALDFGKIFTTQIEERHYTPKELMYGEVPGFNLSPFDYKKYLDFIDEHLGNNNKIISLPLKSFNTKHFYYAASSDLTSYINSYIGLIENAIKENRPVVASSLNDLVYKSRIYSEIEGTLNVENVPTTRKRLKELLEKNIAPETMNDVIIKNMDEGIKYVYSLPEFNKDNLLKLYKILSNNCLKDEDKIKEGQYYRDDSVEVDNYIGCPVEKIHECMESLFEYIEHTLATNNLYQKLLLPHICHYYLLYIHPYFDYNGRTARMVSLWISLLAFNDKMPPLISEAINQNKNEYYKALQNTRDSRNDVTYFLLYIFETSINYILCYENLDNINQLIKNQDNVLTDTELNYIKRILITYKGKFSYLDFIKNCQIDISKQGAFKILNKFLALKILTAVDTSSKVKLFDINNKVIKYRRLHK